MKKADQLEYEYKQYARVKKRKAKEENINVEVILLANYGGVD